MRRVNSSGPDSIIITPEVASVDEYGTPIRVPSGNVITLTAHVQRSTATEEDSTSQGAESSWRFTTTRRLPVGAWAALTVNGRRADVVGEPQWQGRSGRTGHTLVRFEFVDAPEVGS